MNQTIYGDSIVYKFSSIMQRLMAHACNGIGFLVKVGKWSMELDILDQTRRLLVPFSPAQFRIRRPAAEIMYNLLRIQFKMGSEGILTCTKWTWTIFRPVLDAAGQISFQIIPLKHRCFQLLSPVQSLNPLTIDAALKPLYRCDSAHYYSGCFRML